MVEAVRQRLQGCRADALDGYLRGLGLLVLTDRAGIAMRSSWSANGMLELHLQGPEASLFATLAETDLDRLLPEVRTPWRGKDGRGASFAELRNSASDGELAWFDACAVPLLQREGDKSDKRNNPLLGQGGGFGRSQLASAYEDARALLEKASTRRAVLATALEDLLMGREPAQETVKQLSVRNKVLGAYQSGRATGPGATRADGDPSGQQAWTNAWDLVLVVAGTRCFTGSLARRGAPGAALQTTFPLLVRSRAIGLDTGNTHSLREEDDNAYELLAPLWSAAARTDVVLHRLRTLRVRVASGAPARDALEAAVAQAATAAGAAGFDRLERFALFAPSDPRYRFALHRGRLTARSSEMAIAAGRDLLAPRRRMEAAAGDRPPEGVRRARSAFDEALARDEPAMTTLLALTRYEHALGQSLDESRRERLRLAWLDRRWDVLASGQREAGWRIGRGLAWAFETPLHTSRSAGWLRGPLLGQRFDGAWRLDPSRRAVDVFASATPLDALVREAIAEGRRLRDVLAFPAPVLLRDIVALLSGADDREVVSATLGAARLDGVVPTSRTQSGEDTITRADIGRWGIDRFTAVVMLAAQSESAEEPAGQLLARRLELASFALARDRAQLLRTAMASLWRRALPVAPVAPTGSLPARPEALAFALLLTIDPRVVHALQDRVAPPTTERGGQSRDERQ